MGGSVVLGLVSAETRVCTKYVGGYVAIASLSKLSVEPSMDR